MAAGLTVIGRAARSMHMAHFRDSSKMPCWPFPASFSWLPDVSCLEAANAVPTEATSSSEDSPSPAVKRNRLTFIVFRIICLSDLRLPSAAHDLLTFSSLFRFCQIRVLLDSQNLPDKTVVVHAAACSISGLILVQQKPICQKLQSANRNSAQVDPQQLALPTTSSRQITMACPCPGGVTGSLTLFRGPAQLTRGRRYSMLAHL